MPAEEDGQFFFVTNAACDDDERWWLTHDHHRKQFTPFSKMPSGDAELKMIFLFKFKSHFFFKGLKKK